MKTNTKRSRQASAPQTVTQPIKLKIGGQTIAITTTNQKISAQAGPGNDVFQSSLELSGLISMPEVNDELYRQFEQLAPFGRNNPEPVFLFEPVAYARPPQHFGKNHIKLFIRAERGEIEAVGFGLGQHDWSKPPKCVAGTLDWDDYRNRVQIRIADWQMTSSL
jgi:single-stranded-DNA-specific exonuclease